MKQKKNTSDSSFHQVHIVANDFVRSANDWKVGIINLLSENYYRNNS